MKCAYKLVEAGFEYVTEVDDIKIFQKPKSTLRMPGVC